MKAVYRKGQMQCMANLGSWRQIDENYFYNSPAL
jgi:hypothetical protein